MTYAKSFKDLEVYKLTRKLAGEIYETTKKFPKEELYSLTSQLRNSSRSIGAQISEAWAKRCYEKHFITKLTDADGELQETEYWLEIAHDCGYLNCEKLKYFSDAYADLGRMISSMINKSNVFCKQ